MRRAAHELETRACGDEPQALFIGSWTATHAPGHLERPDSGPKAGKLRAFRYGPEYFTLSGTAFMYMLKPQYD